MTVNVVPTKDGFAVVKNVHGKVRAISTHSTEDDAQWAAFKHAFKGTRLKK
jgi:hypothetical protein